MIFTYILILIFFLSSYNSAISNSIHHFCKCECEVNIFFLSDSHLIYCYYFFYQSVSTAQKSQWKNLFYCFFTKKTIKYKKAQDFLCSFAVILYIEDVDLNWINEQVWPWYCCHPLHWGCGFKFFHYGSIFCPGLSSSTLRMWI